MRTNSRAQRAKRQMKREQRIANRNYQHYRLIDSLNRNTNMTQAQRAQYMQGQLEIYEANKTGHSQGLQFETYNTRTEKGALIAMYYDYVDKGWIRPQSFLDVYDAAEYMERTISEVEMQKAIQKADEWRSRTQQREMERRAERNRNRPIIDF